VVHPLDQVIGRLVLQRLRLKTVSYAAAQDTGVSGSADVYRAVADHQCSFLSGAGFPEQRFHSDGMWLFLFEAIPSIYAEKMLPNSKPIENAPADADRLIG
jgi:hypothetical protein